MTVFFVGLAAVVLGGVAGVSKPARRLSGILTALGCGAAVFPALRVLVGGAALETRVALPAPWGPWVFGIDLLSAAFLVVVLIPGLASAISGLDDFRPATAFLFAIELVALALVVTARAVVPFLAAWEVMAVIAYFLVITDSDRAEVRRAGLVYLVATHAGTLALLALFAIWAGAGGGLTFADLATRVPLLPAGGAVVLWLALVGFGLKAGLVPLHFWLPGAHAAAPTAVSALMSGVVIKMGIYGLFRLVSLVAAPPAWFGWVLLGLGVVSGVLGVLWALAQHDLKRLLAYHSVENIGIILTGLGAGALGVAYHIPFIAVVGFAGALLHTLNHALFKSLLFLGAGSILHATGTRALDELGGLGRRMPLTWVAFLTGSVAIVGLPPLNGFVSEWLVYQALLGTGGGAAMPMLLVGVAGLALVGGLALACFAKICGVVFLGTPRSAAAERGHDGSRSVVGSMFGLAAACVAIGVAPVAAVRPALAAGAAIAGAPVAAAGPVGATVGMISLLAVAVIALLGLGVAGTRAVLRRRPVTVAPTWACGYGLPGARMQYTASSFAAPLLAVFGPLAGIHTSRSGDGATFHSHPRELVLDEILLPLWHRVRAGLARLRTIQHGRLGVYLLYVIVALLLSLLYLAGLLGPGSP